MKTLFVTLNYNASKLMDQLYESLAKHLPEKGWEWFVRDNSDKEYWTCSDKRVTVKTYANSGNYASMHNDLMKEGVFDDYDYICLLNNDMWALNDFLTPMRSILSDDSVGAVGALLLFPDGKLQHSGIVFYEDGTPMNVNQLVISKLGLWQGIAAHNREFQAVTGACLLMRVADYKKLGGMDERFNWCFDDVDLCLRITQTLKKKCVFAKDAHLVHIENYSTLKNPTELKPKFREASILLRQKFVGSIKPDTWLYQMDYGKYR